MTGGVSGAVTELICVGVHLTNQIGTIDVLPTQWLFV